MYERFNGPKGVWNTWGNMSPADPLWWDRNGGLYHQGSDYKVPTLWVSSWFDLSTAPNLELVNHIIENASEKRIRDNQYHVIAPTEHCAQYRLETPHMVGDMNLGDVRFNFAQQLWDFLDRFAKDKNNGFENNYPKVKYFSLGDNKWNEATQWPPKKAQNKTYYFSSNKGANTRFGDGLLTTAKSTKSGKTSFDQFDYDPKNPVPSLGGNLWGSEAGSYDNS